MSTVILHNIPYEVNGSLLLKKLHLTDESDADRALELLQEAQKIAHPKGMYLPSYIESKEENTVNIGGFVFTSRVLRVNLDTVNRVFPYVATSGMELEAWSRSMNDFVERFWADTIREMILGSAVVFLKNHIKENYALEQISAMNPGSLEDWPITQQEQLFSLVGNTRDTIGVSLTDSFLMVPSKSVSGIVFPTKSGFESCQLCPRPDCPNRRAPYDAGLYNRKYRKNNEE